MTNLWKVVSALALVVSVVSVFFAFQASNPTLGTVGGKLVENYNPYVRYNGGMKTALPIWTTSTFEADGASTFSGAIAISGLATFSGGYVFSDVLSTSTNATAETLNATDVSNYSSVLLSPNVNSVTVTFPASSTLSTFLATAGQWNQQCWFNATSTAAKTITFAAGTGETLLSASTTLAILPGASRCYTILRNGGTGTKANDFSIELQ